MRLDDELSLTERSNLMLLERQLHRAWGLGANVILSWSRCEDGVLVLTVPHYELAEFVTPRSGGNGGATVSTGFIEELISGRRELAPAQLDKVTRLLQREPQLLRLTRPLSGTRRESELIERMIRRYSISHIAGRAVALFDIVGFGLLSPFAQMTQLNSLSYSINAAHSRMLDRRIGVNFARSSTGDGFYIWNRDDGLEANTNLYHFMHLVLADNAIARGQSRAGSVPLLRTAFHVGSCYEFHLAEGLNPSLYDFIVGDVTIDLARMIERALPGQILFGEFDVDIAESATTDTDYVRFDAHRFMRQAQSTLSHLNGLELAGERIEAIRCYLTGERREDDQYSIRRLTIADKHGLSRNVYNAKVNIYRQSADPILLGLEDRVISRTPTQSTCEPGADETDDSAPAAPDTH